MNDFNQYTEHSSWYFSIKGFFFSFVNYYIKIFIAFLQQYVTKGFVYYIHLDRSVTGVCKTRTGYLRMADADGKMRIEKCGWKKNADNKKSKKKKNEKCG